MFSVFCKIGRKFVEKCSNIDIGMPKQAHMLRADNGFGFTNRECCFHLQFASLYDGTVCGEGRKPIASTSILRQKHRLFVDAVAQEYLVLVAQSSDTKGVAESLLGF
jgi:hypothetical protein